ncbi:hypothetical protein [Kutzneria albida]|uniref:hypothetical protein n=1 Tax=Kutzneria albida TaxID=43357 RepID=UPI0011DE4B7E|nr:hypothetical protein [Kutzneria albida]
MNAPNGTFVTGTTYAPLDSIVTEAIVPHNVMKVPFETPNVSKGTFMTLPGRGAKVPFAALSAVKATFAAH